MREQKVAIIGGTGDLGFGLALRWALAGVQVIIGSRDEGRAKEGARRIEESLKAHAPKSERDFDQRNGERRRLPHRPQCRCWPFRSPPRQKF